MDDETRKELLNAYQMIRDLTKQVCGLNRLVLPLIRSLQPDYSRLGMAGREDIDREGIATLDRDETEALRFANAQIRRLTAPTPPKPQSRRGGL
jgi:hypothetical protein